MEWRVVRASLGYLTSFNDVMALVDFVYGYVDRCLCLLCEYTQ